MIAISSSGDGIIRLMVVMTVLTGLAVLLRFLARTRTGTPYAADDFWIAASLVFFYSYMGLQTWSVVSGGLGYPLATLPFPQVEFMVKTLYKCLPFSVSTTATAKISILCLYRRVFTTPVFRRNSFLVGLGVVGCWLASILGAFLGCRPVQKFWQPQLPGTCTNFPAFFLGIQIVNCLLDIVMLTLPLRVIRDLQLPLRQKIPLIAIFLMGGFVLVAGIARMAVIYRVNAPLSVTGDAVWATIENGLAVICACLPTYRPLIPKNNIISPSIKRWYTSLLHSTQGWRGTGSRPSDHAENSIRSDQHYNRYGQIEDGGFDKVHLTEAVGGFRAEEGAIAGQNMPNTPRNAITVRSIIEIR